MKKTMMIVAGIIAGVIALGGSSVYAAGQIARSNAIGEETARNFAYVDAGILPEEAEAVKTEFDFEKGKFVYEIEFTVNGTAYEYTVDSSTGSILERESKLLPGWEPAVSEAGEQTSSGAPEPESVNMIPMEQAKNTALQHAGVSAEEVTFTKTKVKWESGRQIYEVEFFTADGTEYEYDIDAATGTVMEADREAPALSSETSSASNEAASQIGVEEAKNIALQHAGISASNAVFSKARLEWENGIQIYDIEFFAAGIEYEYEIDAASGAVLDTDVEYPATESGVVSEIDDDDEDNSAGTETGDKDDADDVDDDREPDADDDLDEDDPDDDDDDNDDNDDNDEDDDDNDNDD